MIKLLISILATTMLIATTLSSAEIIPLWNKAVEDNIQDMEFLPGGDEFMITTGGGEIQIRSTDNGELIRSHIDNSNLFMNGYFELTPDSTRVVMCISGLLQLINLEDFERLNFFAFGNDTIAKGFKDIVLDPIKPYAYVIITGWEKTSGKNELRSKISVYNYETMELVKDLTEYSGYEFTSIAVSDDGKYLATLNDGKAYLKVWDLEKMELIRDVQLWDDKLPNADWWCDSKDIHFSQLNSAVIYYSGYFTHFENDIIPNGIYGFDFVSHQNYRILDTTKYSGGNFVIFQDGNQLFNYNGFYLELFDLKRSEVTNRIKISKEFPFQGKGCFDVSKSRLISFSGVYFGAIQFDIISNIKSNYEKEIIVSPNPTNSFVNINLNCIEPIVNYQINDLNGLLLFQNTTPNQVGNSLQINFTPYPSGVYFLTINCNAPKTYKIVKEG